MKKFLISYTEKSTKISGELTIECADLNTARIVANQWRVRRLKSIPVIIEDIKEIKEITIDK